MIIQKRIPPRSHASRNNNGAIPRIIHQTFKTQDLPSLMHGAVMSWVDLNPEYEYRFHDDDEARNFLRDAFEPEVLQAYDTLQSGAFKADLWRYCRLYVDGGIYSDIDQVCHRPLSEFLSPEDEFVSARAGNLPFAIYNGFICTKPSHPFLRKAIDRAVDLILSGKETDGYMAVGPWNLGVAVNGCLGRPEKSAFEFGETDENGFRLRLVKKLRPQFHGPGYLEDEDGQVILFTEYEGYRDELSGTGLRHWTENRPSLSMLQRIARRVKRVIGRR